MSQNHLRFSILRERNANNNVTSKVLSRTLDRSNKFIFGGTVLALQKPVTFFFWFIYSIIFRYWNIANEHNISHICHTLLLTVSIFMWYTTFQVNWMIMKNYWQLQSMLVMLPVRLSLILSFVFSLSWNCSLLFYILSFW